MKSVIRPFKFKASKKLKKAALKTFNTDMKKSALVYKSGKVEIYDIIEFSPPKKESSKTYTCKITFEPCYPSS